MDQVKIGAFLRELRKEKELSQEQLAEQFGVSSRSVSRWENGNTMPDISILIELADYYDVDIRDLLNGERKSENMNNELKDTLKMVAEYTNEEKEKMRKDIVTMMGASVFFFAMLGLIVVLHLNRVHEFFDTAAVFCSTLGLVYSIMGLIKFQQINGKVSKDRFRKLVITLILVGVAVMFLSILMILFAVGIIG